MEPRRVVAVFISLMVVSGIVIGIAVTQLTKVRGGSPGPGPSAVAVEIGNIAFKPENITIVVNTNVTWKNNDSVAHTVTSVDGAPATFNSGVLSTGQSYTFRFIVPGTYQYYCTIHPFMRGNVTVVTQQKTASVSIQNLAFKPADITVSVGTTVTWTNNDSVAHTVTSQVDSAITFNSGVLNPGATYSFTFATVGTFPYYCMLHPFMVGNVTVTM